MKLLTTGFVVGALCMPLPAAAQAGLGSLEVGQQVRVTDAAGNRITGRVDTVTSERVTVNGRVLTTAELVKVERQGDSIWNGVAIGGAVGLLFPLLPTEACDHQSRAGCIASGIESGALLGLLFDWLHKGYTTVYRADQKPTPRLIALLDNQRRGAAVRFIW